MGLTNLPHLPSITKQSVTCLADLKLCTKQNEHQLVAGCRCLSCAKGSEQHSGPKGGGRLTCEFVQCMFDALSCKGFDARHRVSTMCEAWVGAVGQAQGGCVLPTCTQ